MDTDKINNIIQKLSKIYNVDNEFPVSVLPKKIQSIIGKTTDDLNFTTDYITSAILHAASSAIGNAVNLDFKWREAPVLYMIFIGRPGAGKSHPINWAYAPLHKIDDLCYKYYEKCLAEYEAAKLPGLEKPILKQLIVSDTTIEALNVALVHNKRCVAVVADELSGFLNSMGRNQQQYLSLWSRQPHVIDRKTSKRIRIKVPFASILGCIQTGIFADVMKRGNKLKNGFLDRCLLVQPKNIAKKKWNAKGSASNAAVEWEEIINNLIEGLPLRLDEKNNIDPQLIYFTEEAEKAVIHYQNNPPDYNIELDDETMDRITAKMDVYFLRLCIIVHLLKWACGEGEKDAIDVDTVKGTVALCEYYKRNAFQVWEDLSKTNPLDRLTLKQLNVYKALPSKFLTAHGIRTAEENEMPKRTFSHWLRDTSLFKKIDYGCYEKVYKR